ncbi:MAG: winged helix-turn-helix domain-containing protein [Candidatus Ancillula sp.]|jgi:DNA-binding response OmpR family regulator|nr:winged helix-turn-helix domain-containing protein [Candidatus Ancillula sp.]
MARVLVVTDIDEIDFFKHFSRDQNLWEFRPLRLTSIQECTFFDCLVIYATKDIHLLRLVMNYAEKHRNGVPILLILDTCEHVTEFTPADFFIFKNDPRELSARIKRIANPYPMPKPDSEHSTGHTAKRAPTPDGHNSNSKAVHNAQSGKGESSKRTEEERLSQGGKNSAKIVLKKQSNSVYLKGERVHLTLVEFKIFRLLFSNPNKVFSRLEIETKVANSTPINPNSRAIDVHIRRIRSKLGPTLAKHILTQRARGYYYEEL